MVGEIKRILDGARRDLAYFEKGIGKRDERWAALMAKLAEIRNSRLFDSLPASVQLGITLVHDVLLWTPRDKLNSEMLRIAAMQLRILANSFIDVEFEAIHSALDKAGFYLGPGIKICSD